jgi:hypothetical protein
MPGVMGNKMTKLPYTSQIPAPLEEADRIKELFKHELVEMDDEELKNNGIICAICLELMIDAHILQKCDHNLCYECADNLIKANTPLCPFCRKQFKEKHILPDGVKMTQVQTLVFKCSEFDGANSICEWKGPLKDLARHWKYECKRNVYCNCGVCVFLQGECDQLEKHKRNNCKLIRFCEKCENNGEGVYEKDWAEHVTKHLKEEKDDSSKIYNFRYIFGLTEPKKHSKKFYDKIEVFSTKGNGIYILYSEPAQFKWEADIHYYDLNTQELVDKRKYDGTRILNNVENTNIGRGSQLDNLPGFKENKNCIMVLFIKVSVYPPKLE